MNEIRARSACGQFAAALGSEVDPISIRVHRASAAEHVALVVLRERIGDVVRYRGATAAAAEDDAAVMAAVGSALLADASVVVAAAERWPLRDGVLAVAHHGRHGTRHLSGDGPLAGEQERLLEVCSEAGVLEVDTDLAHHCVVVVPPDAVAVAVAPTHAVRDGLDDWTRTLQRTLDG